MQSSFQPDAVEGHEGSPTTAPAYCYAIVTQDLSTAQFFTSWENDVTISGLPARFNGGDPQTFTAAQISHDKIDRKADFVKHAFQVSGRFDLGTLSSYFLTTPATPVVIEVIRIAKGTFDDGAAAVWGEDTFVVQSGLLETVSLRGDIVTAAVVPKVFHMESAVPRVWFNRTCQWALYGTGCGLNHASFEWATQIDATNRRARQITLSGRQAGMDSDHFRLGFMTHVASGETFTISHSAHTGASDTLAVLGHWSASLEIGDQVKLFPGCRHNRNQCENKFNNLANYGGFSKVPNRNPSLHGV